MTMIAMMLMVFPKNTASKNLNFRRIHMFRNKNDSCMYAVQSSKQSQFTPTDVLIYRFNNTIFGNCCITTTIDATVFTSVVAELLYAYVTVPCTSSDLIPFICAVFTSF